MALADTFPTGRCPTLCPYPYKYCSCEVCRPVHCPDCEKNFINTTDFRDHIRRPCHAKHSCGGCFLLFIRRLDLIKHYESGACRSNIRAVRRAVETTPLLPIVEDVRFLRPPSLVTKRSWNLHTKRYKYYLCNPAKLGFHTLEEINSHLATEHEAKRYKCPHSACNRPFNSIGGLVQHIESRGCRCMTDGKWWNGYLAPPGKKRTGVVSPDQLQAELELEEYWVHRYFEMTGRGGRWEWKDSLLHRVGLVLLVVLWSPVLVPMLVISGYWSLVQSLRECVRALPRILLGLLRGLWFLLLLLVDGLLWLMWGLLAVVQFILLAAFYLSIFVLFIALIAFIFSAISDPDTNGPGDLMW